MRERPRNDLPSPDPLKCLEEGAPPVCDDTRSEASSTTACSDASSNKSSEPLPKTVSSWSIVWRIGVLSAISMVGGVAGQIQPTRNNSSSERLSNAYTLMPGRSEHRAIW